MATGRTADLTDAGTYAHTAAQAGTAGAAGGPHATGAVPMVETAPVYGGVSAAPAAAPVLAAQRCAQNQNMMRFSSSTEVARSA